MRFYYSVLIFLLIYKSNGFACTQVTKFEPINLVDTIVCPNSTVTFSQVMNPIGSDMAIDSVVWDFEGGIPSRISMVGPWDSIAWDPLRVFGGIKVDVFYSDTGTFDVKITEYCSNDKSTMSGGTSSGGLWLTPDGRPDTAWMYKQDYIDVVLTPGMSFINIGNDTTVNCVDDASSLSYNGNSGFSSIWSNGMNDTSSTVVKSGTQWVVVYDTLTACYVSDTIAISSMSSMNIDLGEDTIICSYLSVLLDAADPEADAYLWSTGASASFIDAAPGTYSVVATQNIPACTSSDTIIITAAPDIEEQDFPDTCLYPGEKITLSAKDGYVYNWSNGSSAQSLEAAIGNYFIHINDTFGCYELSDTIYLKNCLTLGRNEIFENKLAITIFPNPVIDQAIINFENISGFSNIDMILYDLLGNQVKTYYHIDDNYFLFNREQIPAGTYIFKIANNQFVTSGKIILL